MHNSERQSTSFSDAKFVPYRTRMFLFTTSSVGSNVLSEFTSLALYMTEKMKNGSGS